MSLLEEFKDAKDRTCGCRFDNSKKKWHFCEEANRLHRIYMLSTLYEDLIRYNEHFKSK